MLDKALWDRVVLSKWKVLLLSTLFPRRWWVQIRGKVYILRTPVE